MAACGGSALVGRAWFHPAYTADDVGHSSVVPGHAVPHDLVLGFAVNQPLGTQPQQQPQQGQQQKQLEQPTPQPQATVAVGAPPLSRAAVAAANDLVRRTPHATVNLLRRAQLLAAARHEAATAKALPPAARPKPNAIYVRNVAKLARQSGNV